MVLARILDVVEYDELGNGYIDFGTYPQKRITDTKLISELNALIIKNGEKNIYQIIINIML